MRRIAVVELLERTQETALVLRQLVEGLRLPGRRAERIDRDLLGNDLELRGGAHVQLVAVRIAGLQHEHGDHDHDGDEQQETDDERVAAESDF